MAKPIPVFSFVFVAYAATCISPSSSRSLSPKRVEASDPFLSAWLTRSTRNGALFAKIGLLPGATSDELRFALRSSKEIYEEFWLETVSETRLGFIGAATVGPGLPVTIKPGQRMRFDRINVLDWRMGDRRPESVAAEPLRLRRDPREMLAALSESVVNSPAEAGERLG